MGDESKSGHTPEEIAMRELQRPLFNSWFTGLLLVTETCLERDVLRGSKDQLFNKWVEIQPHGDGII